MVNILDHYICQRTTSAFFRIFQRLRNQSNPPSSPMLLLYLDVMAAPIHPVHIAPDAMTLAAGSLVEHTYIKRPSQHPEVGAVEVDRAKYLVISSAAFRQRDERRF
jgi:hypothetical protein